VQNRTEISEKPDQPERASAHAGSAIWLLRLPFTKPLAVATSLIDPFDPDGRGAVLRRRSLFTLLLNRPQANTEALPLLPPVYPIPGAFLYATPTKLLYEPSEDTATNLGKNWVREFAVLIEKIVIEQFQFANACKYNKCDFFR
jgi:hypothetical protein